MRDIELFNNTKLSDLLEEIHDNAVTKRNDINAVVKQLVGMMTDANDASQLLPLIKDLYEVGVKNDEQIVKVATIAQRIISADAYQSGKTSSDNGQILSELEKDQLINNAFSGITQISGVDDKIDLAKETIKNRNVN